jgi:hypothetical protein
LRWSPIRHAQTGHAKLPKGATGDPSGGVVAFLSPRQVMPLPPTIGCDVAQSASPPERCHAQFRPDFWGIRAKIGDPSRVRAQKDRVQVGLSEDLSCVSLRHKPKMRGVGRVGLHYHYIYRTTFLFFLQRHRRGWSGTVNKKAENSNACVARRCHLRCRWQRRSPQDIAKISDIAPHQVTPDRKKLPNHFDTCYTYVLHPRLRGTHILLSTLRTQ